MELDVAQFDNIVANAGAKGTGSPFSHGSLTFLQYVQSLYDTPYAFVFGNATFVYPVPGTEPVGFYDYCDLDWHITPRSEEKGVEWKVRVAAALTAPLNPMPFHIRYGVQPL